MTKENENHSAQVGGLKNGREFSGMILKVGTPIR